MLSSPLATFEASALMLFEHWFTAARNVAITLAFHSLRTMSVRPPSRHNTHDLGVFSTTTSYIHVPFVAHHAAPARCRDAAMQCHEVTRPRKSGEINVGIWYFREGVLWAGLSKYYLRHIVCSARPPHNFTSLSEQALVHRMRVSPYSLRCSR